MDMEEVSLQLWAMDRDRLSKGTKMGMVHVGANSLQESGQKHWQEALNSHDHMTSLWHTIIPHHSKASSRPSPVSSPSPFSPGPLTSLRLPDLEEEGPEKEETSATRKEEM